MPKFDEVAAQFGCDFNEYMVLAQTSEKAGSDSLPILSFVTIKVPSHYCSVSMEL